MAVMINDMELPRNCGECRFYDGDWCYAVQIEWQNPTIDPAKTSEWCPLVRVVGAYHCYEDSTASEAAINAARMLNEAGME